MLPRPRASDIEAWKKQRPEAFAGLDPNEVTGAIAVLVFHGMGQQAQFETVNDVIQAFIRAHEEHDWEVIEQEDHWLGRSKKGSVDLFKPRKRSDTLIPVGQITLQSKDHKQQQFDFFEAYWAPLTEGKVGLWDCLSFLLRASAEGMMVAFAKKEFSRAIFGKTEEYPVGIFAGFQLLFAGLTVFCLAAICWAYIAVLGQQLLNFIGLPLTAMSKGTYELRELLSRFLILTSIFLLLPFSTAVLLKKSARFRQVFGTRIRSLNFLLVFPVLSAIVYYGLSAVATVSTHGTFNPTDRFGLGMYSADGASILGNLVFVLTGGLLISGIWYFTVKFLGDVVAYVSAHAVNRFWEVRESVQERCLRISKGIYTRKDKKDPQRLLYEHVVIVSHSLGSVIAYDILNWLLNLELCGGTPPCLTRVADRTRLFITCGSPLNKIAFLFRFNIGLFSQPKKRRDRLNNYRQPLLLSYQWRPHRWINIWSYPDWISGRLSYFELPKVRKGEFTDWVKASAENFLTPRALRIFNIPDPEAFIPLFSHTSYFAHQQFRNAVYNGIWSAASDDWGMPVSSVPLDSNKPKAVGQAAG